jgi:predicted O-linked N-acetylglucosamine transferase (SPINDLY family)
MTPSSPSGADEPVETLAQQALAARQAGRLAEAANLFGRALAAAPPHPQLLLLAGETLYRLGLWRSAEDAITAALRLQPDDPSADLLLGRILQARGQPGEALTAFQRVTAARPSDAMAWRFQATALMALGRRSEAQARLASADALQPEGAAGYNEFGISLLAERHPAEAEMMFRQAIILEPGLVAAWLNLGAALAAQDRLDEAIDAERRAIGHQSNSAAGWTNLGAFANASGRFREARQALQQAYALAPGSPDTLNNLANLRLDEGDAAGAWALLDSALRSAPAHRSAADNWLLTRNYLSDTPSADWREKARQIVRQLRPESPPLPYRGSREPGRRLRIGFVSADFRRHSCASFLAPLFSHWPRHELELFAYSDNVVDDEVTVRLKAQADSWCPITAYSDIALTERVSDDRIDILVDLAGHMAGNRLPAFALKPAPIQVSWLGYPDTSGLDTIDYRLTDAVADPPGRTELLHSETLWRLPRCFLAFAAEPAAADGEDRRSEENGIVFGSFNHLPKVTPAVVAAWARLLAAVPQSRLLLKAKRLGEPETRERYRTLFATHGIDQNRLDLVGWRSSPGNHLALYRQVDIALDPFPYNGTTTTCEALAMGVPLLTLAGSRHASRVGASLLTAVGLEALIATSVDDYVARGIALAGDNDRRRAIRRALQAGIATSPLCDAEGFAGDFAAAMRGMWKRWCETAA